MATYGGGRNSAISASSSVTPAPSAQPVGHTRRNQITSGGKENLRPKAVNPAVPPSGVAGGARRSTSALRRVPPGQLSKAEREANRAPSAGRALVRGVESAREICGRSSEFRIPGRPEKDSSSVRTSWRRGETLNGHLSAVAAKTSRIKEAVVHVDPSGKESATIKLGKDRLAVSSSAEGFSLDKGRHKIESLEGNPALLVEDGVRKNYGVCTGKAFVASDLSSTSDKCASSATAPTAGPLSCAKFKSNGTKEHSDGGLTNNIHASANVISGDTLKISGDDSVKQECQISGSSARADLVEDAGIAADDKNAIIGSTVNRVKVLKKIKALEKLSDSKPLLAVNKYPSKLHEKLAALEGRVQKIATEIKRTKEMLDENNPDEPKLILSNIQKEISAIEKVIGHVKDENRAQLGTSVSIDTSTLKSKDAAKAVGLKQPLKGLDSEELEARFFPHHKLMRNRRLPDDSCEELLVAAKMDCSLSPLEENTVALEFLASLDNGKNTLHGKGNVCDTGDASSYSAQIGSQHLVTWSYTDEPELLASEKIEELDEQENQYTLLVPEDKEEASAKQLREIGSKLSTGGWFVSEWEAVLLAHSDATCSYYDITNCEFKSIYKPPTGVSHNIWRDCWLIRAPGVDGCSGKYVIAASAGNCLEAGFCSWDFYTREVKAFHLEDENSSSSKSSCHKMQSAFGFSRTNSTTGQPSERQQWWYMPSGPLLLATANKLKFLAAYDIRDGEEVMKWDMTCPVVGMEYSCPLQWRSRSKVVIAGTECVSLWDVNSMNPQELVSVSSADKKIYSLHINNTDAELGGGVRQRVSSSEVDGNDGVFITQDCLNVLDFRTSSGIGLKVSNHGATANAIFSRGDMILLGCSENKLKGNIRSYVQQFSLRKGRLVATYELPESSSHYQHSSISQVWGSNNVIMAVCGMGLFVYDPFKDDALQTLIRARETVGSDDLCMPTFDYQSSRVLLVSRDRPACWRYLM